MMARNDARSSDDSFMSGSIWTEAECLLGVDLRGYRSMALLITSERKGVFVGTSGTNTSRIWQKCSFRFSKRVVFVRLGLRTTPSTLVTSDGCGHRSLFRVNLLPVVSRRGSKANVESVVNKSVGRFTSTNSPGQTVVLVGGARNTWVRRTACQLRDSSVVPYV